MIVNCGIKIDVGVVIRAGKNWMASE
jgi:hypothetical protein